MVLSEKNTRGDQHAVNLPGNVALEAADDLSLALAFCSTDLAIKCATHSGSTVGRKIRSPAYPRPIPMGFHAFHKPDFPPSQIRLCVAGFMTRFAAVRLATYSLVRRSRLIRARQIMYSARLASRLPPRLRRWRTTFPEEASTGDTPQRLAKEASLLNL